MAEPVNTPAPEPVANDPGVDTQSVDPPKSDDTGASGLSLDDLLPGNDNAAKERLDTEEPANDNAEAEKEADPKEEVTAEQLFTAEALATPEGIGRAREVLLKAKDHLEHRHHRLDRFDARLKARSKKDNAEREQAWGQIRPVQEMANRFLAEVKTLRKGSGATAKERWATISRIAGEDPQAFYEEVSIGIATDGKQPPPSKEFLALQQKFDQLEAQRHQEREQFESAQAEARLSHLETQINRVRAEIAQDCSNVEAYPALANRIVSGALDASEAAQWVVDFMTDHHERTGNRLDRSDAIANLEERLARAVGGSASRAPQGESRTVPRKGTGSPAPAAGRRGVTVTPTLADRSTGTSKKTLTHEERLAEIARDPQALADLGLSRYL